jgi:hypothetical protein
MTDQPMNSDRPTPDDGADEPELYVHDILKQHPQAQVDHILMRLQYLADQAQRPEQLLEELRILNAELQRLQSHHEGIHVLMERVEQFYEDVIAVRETQLRQHQQTRAYLRKLLVINSVVMSGIISLVMVGITRLWIVPQTERYWQSLQHDTEILLQEVRKIEQKLGIPTPDAQPASRNPQTRR